MYQLVSSPLTGSSQPAGWAQVVAHPQQHFVCAVALRGSSVHELGRELVASLLSLHLHSALDLHQFAQQLLEQCQSQNVELQFAAQLLTAETSVMCTYNGFVYLKRASKIGLILPVQDSLQIVEGKTHLDDVYLLGTADTAAFEAQLQKTLADTHEPDAFVTQLMQHVLGAEDSSCVAAAYIQIVPEQVVTHQSDQDVSPSVSHSATPMLSESPTEELISSSPTIKNEAKAAPAILTSITHGLAHISTGGKAVISSVREITQSLFSRDVYVRKQSTKHAIKIIIPVILLVLILGTGAFFWRMQQSKQIQAAQAVTQPAEAELSEIKLVAADQPLEARARAEALIAMLEGKIQQFDAQPTAKKAVQKELATVKNYYQTISGQQELNILPTFFDLRLFQSDFLANRMDIQQNNLFFLDPEKKKMLALDKNTKQTTLLPLGDVPSLKDFTVNDKNAYLLGGGISSFRLGTNANPTVLKSPDLDTEPAISIRSYGSYLYLVHPDKRNIFRYLLQENDKISSPAAWLKPDEKFDVSTVQSMAIDGDVWITTKTGEVKRFTSGRSVDFSIKGLKESLSTPTKIFTKDSLENIYLLEPQKNRVIVLSKNGDLLKEVRSSTLASASDVVADEQTKTIYILSGSLVFEVKF